MSDSQKFSDMPGAQKDSVAHFGDLADQILAGQIAARQQRQPGSTDSSNSQFGAALPVPEQRTFGATPWQNPNTYRPAQVDRAPWMPPETQPTPPMQQPNRRQNDTLPPSDQSYWNPTAPLNTVPQADQSKTEVIPTLHVGQKPNADDGTAYLVNSTDAQNLRK